MATGTALIVVENNSPPFDIRVWYEATTLRDAGWQVFVICPDMDNNRLLHEPEILEGVTLYHFKLRSAERGVIGYLWEYITAFIAVARLCERIWKRHRFDTLQFCNPPDIFFPLMWLFRLRGVHTIFDHHDLVPEIIASRFHTWPGRIAYATARLSEYLTFRGAHVVLSTNESYRQIAIRRGGVASDHVIVVRNGPQRDTFKPQDPVPELKAGFPHLVCFAGVMGHEDGIMTLLDVIRYIITQANRRDIRFALLGDGANRIEALNRIKAWNLTDFVHMPGMVERAVLRQYLATADVCLSPEPSNPLNDMSTFIKVGEYLGMGKPVVAFDLTETHTTAGEAAVYVPCGDTAAYGQAIIDLIDDPERRERMGALGRQRVVDALAWECQQPLLLRAYDLALDPAPARSDVTTG